MGNVGVLGPAREQIQIFLLAISASTIPRWQIELAGRAGTVAHSHGETLARKLIEVETFLTLVGAFALLLLYRNLPSVS